MIDETGLQIALFLGAMIFIALIGILIVCIRWFILKKKHGSLIRKLIPLFLYGIYPFVANPLLNIENPETFLPYIDPKTQLYIHLFVFFAGLIVMIIYYIRMFKG
ncbi:MAG TPA: hypothetical protein VK112_01470 [Fodinibius sp.]|nr:hypothetical protein [Fodinibius sp.]